MTGSQILALLLAVAIQAVTLTIVLPAFNIFAACAIGLADAIIVVVCSEAGA